ncbi:hypothetical protein GCM10009619_41930 [Williamsia maris]
MRAERRLWLQRSGQNRYLVACSESPDVRSDVVDHAGSIVSGNEVSGGGKEAHSAPQFCGLPAGQTGVGGAYRCGDNPDPNVTRARIYIRDLSDPHDTIQVAELTKCYSTHHISPHSLAAFNA